MHALGFELITLRNQILIYKEFPLKLKIDEKYPNIEVIEFFSKINFYFEFSTKDFPKTLLKILETMKKKSQVVFVKFANRCLKNRNQQNRSKYREILNTFFGKYTRFVRRFSIYLEIDFFFHFFTKDVLKRLLRGPKVTSVIYRVVFEE